MCFKLLAFFTQDTLAIFYGVDVGDPFAEFGKSTTIGLQCGPHSRAPFGSIWISMIY
jgi:hypothetical protein